MVDATALLEIFLIPSLCDNEHANLPQPTSIMNKTCELSKL